MLIVSYDMSNNKLRTKFSKLLKKHGRMLQYSVYEINHSQRTLRLILGEIDHYFAERFDNTDSILIFSLCEGCIKRVVRYGYPVAEEQDIVFV